MGQVVTSMIPPPDLGLDGAPHLVFQPVVDLSTGRLLGFEALLRWQDSSGRAVPPNALIPWAEARGRMTDLNAWVLLEACSQAARWPADLQLAVNCSVFQLRRGEAATAAASALEQAGFDPDRLMVEVTETAVIDEAAVADLQAMSRLGIQLTLDDVGSDWSILKNLQDCTVNTMKIDGELIEELKVAGSASQAVVETIVKISRSLGICTVAEAVETAVQVTLLRDAGVDVAQGYFFSPPISADDAFTMAATDPLPKFSLTCAAELDAPAPVDTSEMAETAELDAPAAVATETPALGDDPVAPAAADAAAAAAPVSMPLFVPEPSPATDGAAAESAVAPMPVPLPVPGLNGLAVPFTAFGSATSVPAPDPVTAPVEPTIAAPTIAAPTAPPVTDKVVASPSPERLKIQQLNEAITMLTRAVERQSELIETWVENSRGLVDA
jgi:EAL domain-containing protein (putative c-di-GMP-specific phosphodiesterase class I)